MTPKSSDIEFWTSLRAVLLFFFARSLLLHHCKGSKVTCKKVLETQARGCIKAREEKNKRPSFLVSRSTSQSLNSWFAIALAEIRTRRILREKADCKQYNVEPKKRAVDAFPQTPTTRPKHVWWSLQDKSCQKPFWLSGLPAAGLVTPSFSRGPIILWGGGVGAKPSLLWLLLASEFPSVRGSKFRNENSALMNRHNLFRL